MAARRATSRRKTRRSKSKSRPAKRKKAPAKKGRAKRKKAPGKKRPARRKKAPAKKRPASRKKAPGRKRGARKAGASSLETLARKIVRATQGDPSKFSVADLYADGAVSREPSGDPQVGHAALEEKGRFWETVQDGHAARWKPVHTFTRGNTICIEWEADLKMRDGRQLTFHEVAVHEVRNGKIVSERYYYDPASLAPPAPAIQPASRPALPPTPPGGGPAGPRVRP